MRFMFAKAWAGMLSLGLILGASNEGPELSERDVVNAADHSGGRVAPGEIVVLFPFHAGPAALAGAAADVAGRVPTLLGDTRVLFDGIAAPLAYSVAGQIGAVVPYEIAQQKTTEVVVEYAGLRSRSVTLDVVDRAPAVFTLDLSGRGQAAILNDGCCNSARNPAPRGSVATLYATGEGQTRPLGISGNVSVYPRIADYPVPQSPVQVTVGGETAEIEYAGEAPHAVAGLLQVNFRVPPRAPLGDAIPVVLKIGNSRSVDGITMAVRSAVRRILVVDPQPVSRNRLRRMLTGAGYDVVTAANSRVDLVILSLATPEQESLETIDALRAQWPQLKILAMAGALSPATLRAADLLGAQSVLTNAMARGAVLRRVREALRVRQGGSYAALPIHLNRPIER